MFYLSLVLALVLVVPAAWAEKGDMKAHMKAKHEKMKAHHEEQKSENKAFRESLKGKSKEEKIEAVKTHREEQKGENKEFRQKLHAENKAKLEEKLAANTKLTQEQKNEIMSEYENRYKNASAHRETQQAENKAFFDQIASSEMTQEQRKAAIKAHFAEQKTENKNFRKVAHEGMKAERQKIRGEVKAAAEAVK